MGAGMMLGRQEPSFCVEPKAARTFGDDCAYLSAGYGLAPDPWQKRILDAWLGVRPDGSPSADRCGISVPRQNGKNALIEMRELYGMLVLKEAFLHTAHEVRTARKAFTRLCGFFEDARRHPELAAEVSEVRKTNGQEAIVLKNGASVEFSARSTRAARGYTVDCVVFDEAQELTDEQAQAITSTMAAAPSGHRQLIYAGTPPYPGCPGTVFRDVRDEARGGSPNPSLCWHEWSVPEVGDKMDRERWRAANPSLGIRIPESFVANIEAPTLKPDGFARERLGWWAENCGVASVIGSEDWRAGTVAEPPGEGLRCYAAEFAPDGRFVAVAVCVRPPDGPAFVEVVDAFGMDEGLQRVVDLLVAASAKGSEVCVDGVLAQAALDGMAAAGVRRRKLRRPRQGDVADACAAFAAAVADGRVTHREDAGLDASATRTARRRVGGAGGFRFQSTDEGEAALVEACALAHWSATKAKANHDKRTGVAF